MIILVAHRENLCDTALHLGGLMLFVGATVLGRPRAMRSIAPTTHEGNTTS
ncbi:MAG: hypothetical protein FWE47_02735 [Oscillospiraceae bacterium]|nr:hypothetical protein [Oscillospiraceae bacterium]